MCRQLLCQGQLQKSNWVIKRRVLFRNGAIRYDIASENECKRPDAMNWPQIEDTFYNCLDFCEMYHRLPYFYLTGGDPILHPEFWRLLGLFKEHEIPFTILGNPFHLNNEVCARLKEHGCQKYQLSLDGLRETHDWFRKPGSFDCTMEKIGCIKRAGIRAVIMTTVSGTNIDQIPALIDTMVERKADVWVCEMESYRDYGKFKKCAKCELLPWCRGCPAMASSTFNTWVSS